MAEQLYTAWFFYNAFSQVNYDPIQDMSSKFHTKIATQLYKIILDTDHV